MPTIGILLHDVTIMNKQKQIEFVIKEGCLRDIINPTEEVHIPDGVVSINMGNFRSNTTTKTIHIPATLMYIGDLQYCNIESIVVDSANSMYSSYDGVVYDKCQQTLVACPSHKRGQHRMPSSCRSIASNALCRSCLDELIINEGLTTICDAAFADSCIKSWPVIPRSVNDIKGNPFDGEWSVQDIRVYKNSYAHSFAKKHKIRYRCVPENGETTWSEHEWKSAMSNCRFHNNQAGIDNLKMQAMGNTQVIFHTELYMTAHGHLVTPPFVKTFSCKDYHEVLPVQKNKCLYNTEIRLSCVDTLTLARRLKHIDGSVCVLGMVPANFHFETEGIAQLWVRTDYATRSWSDESYFIPRVTVFRDSEENGYRLLKHPYHINLVTIPYTTDIEMLRNMFRIAKDNEQETLVVEPFLGMAPWSACHYSGLFDMILKDEFKNTFKRVYFALPKEKYEAGEYAMFKTVFEENYNALYFMPNGLLRIDKAPVRGIKIHSEEFKGSLCWSLYSDGTLEISGTGRMPDYTNHWDCYFGENQAPWIGCEKYGVMPYKLHICEGVTYVGANAFESFGCLKEVHLANSVQNLGKQAFYYCFNIQRINIPNMMDIEQFKVAELPMVCNNKYIRRGDLLLSNGNQQRNT